MTRRKKGPVLSLRNFGPIADATVQFGDLTVLVGPQASGKSLFLQTFKLLLDKGFVQAELRKHGFDWNREWQKLAQLYYGEGMSAIWRQSSSRLEWKGKSLDLPKEATRNTKNAKESLFLIPAQRVLSLGKGWPRAFSDYSSGDPFTVRNFSEELRLLMENEIGREDELFPRSRRFKKEYRDLLQRSLFGNFQLVVERAGLQKRLMLKPGGENGESLPFLVWSAGQREFIPLLLGLYWLLPPRAQSKRDEIDWVVIEELEMGLHPRAIETVLLLVLELIHRGYRVCLSTHSPQVLEFLWALGAIREAPSPETRLLDLLMLGKTDPMKKLAKSATDASVKVFYFDTKGGPAVDISDLDPSSESFVETTLGGLIDFSGRAGNAVADAVNAARSRKASHK